MDNFLIEARQKIIDFMQNEYKGEDIRFCSAYLFGSSKYIEKHRELADLFNSLAIVERPNIIYIRTDTDLYINGINIKELTDKLHLAAFFGGDVKSIEQSDDLTVVISENLSFFMSMKPNNAVFLYNKGFHLTKQVATFIKRLSYKKVVFFGDLDCDGLSIYASLKKLLEGLEFYPSEAIAREIYTGFSSVLPEISKSECDSKRIEKNELYRLLIDAGKRIEQEFLQVLFARGKLEKPKWIG
ncbi:Wadjet anti-phage system protein JetD domain-containing protein [Hippea maritima]|uniref:Wadjet protein JetD C-terminal domain-containing protein n=1 Tax=Hippea maritima (strain ATCC 700847 / DSM 10411 / MH2) TaxID=760142 RepID=F2LVS8_HIPMA|nr:Wadjet anti-phage system protein JetD domain-containing protein [Hippea maritima]AEA33862.1 hypothetical protein Hipma_0892 [Hippea maritima DSM 10411]